MPISVYIGPILYQYSANMQPILLALSELQLGRSPLPPLTAFYCYLMRCEIASASLCPDGDPPRTWTIIERLAIDHIRRITIGQWSLHDRVVNVQMATEKILRDRLPNVRSERYFVSKRSFVERHLHVACQLQSITAVYAHHPIRHCYSKSYEQRIVDKFKWWRLWHANSFLYHMNIKLSRSSSTK